MTNRILSLLAAVCVAHSAHSQLVINEIMQSNIDLVIDDTREFPDSWVEISNISRIDHSTQGFSIGLSRDASAALPLPAAQVGAGGSLLLYFDKTTGGNHYPWALDSGKGGEVWLFYDGEPVDSLVNIPKQWAPQVSYGRGTNHGDSIAFLATPTPLRRNAGCAKGLLPQPSFSTTGRVCTDPLTVDITPGDSSPEGTVIRYTLDGSEPTDTSALLTAPLDISTTTIVRAKPFAEGYASPRSTTHSYIFHPREMTLPIVSLTTAPEFLYSDSIGILHNKNYHDYSWRRPVQIEMFEAEEEEAVINQLCETRLKGSGSRGAPVKAQVIYANKRFGTKRLNYEFFPDDAPGITEWKSIDFRNSGNDFGMLHFRDAFVQLAIGRNADIDFQPYQPVVYYLNGEFMAVQNIRSRSNEDYVYSFYNQLEDIDLVENQIIKKGDNTNWLAFKDFYYSEGHTLEEYYQWLDVDEYCDVFLANIFFDNKDFPGNNFTLWRPREASGRWRVIMKDTDFAIDLSGYRNPNYNTLFWVNNPGCDDIFYWGNDKWNTWCIRNLFKFNGFRDLFVAHSLLYTGTFLSAKNLGSMIDVMYRNIETEVNAQYSKYPGWHHNTPYASKELAKEWLAGRGEAFMSHVADFYQLGRVVPLNIETGDSLQITLNGHTLSTPYYHGWWFESMPLEVSATWPDGTPVEHYVMVTADRIIDHQGDKIELNALPMDFLTITPYGMETSVETPKATSSSAVYDLQGRRVPAPAHGLYIANGRKVFRR